MSKSNSHPWNTEAEIEHLELLGTGEWVKIPRAPRLELLKKAVRRYADRETFKGDNLNIDRGRVMSYLDKAIEEETIKAGI